MHDTGLRPFHAFYYTRETTMKKFYYYLCSIDHRTDRLTDMQ